MIKKSVLSQWKEADQLEPRFRSLNAGLQKLVQDQNTKLTVQGSIQEFAARSSAIYGFDPSSEAGYRVILHLKDVKELDEEIPYGNRPLFVVKTTFGPILMFFRPLPESDMGVLFKFCPQDMLKTDDDFAALHAAVRRYNKFYLKKLRQLMPKKPSSVLLPDSKVQSLSAIAA